MELRAIGSELYLLIARSPALCHLLRCFSSKRDALCPIASDWGGEACAASFPLTMPIALPDQFLDAGALPTLHDCYGISTSEAVRRMKGWIG